jgi:phosphopantothenoylcysteine synthetase/decarboxylase
MEDPVLHILLREWADIAVIAPMSAHTMAKIANGLCDDTLSCIMRAWDFGQTSGRPSKPLLVAPAMNTSMWEHPLTKVQLDTIKRFFFVHNDGTESGDTIYESLFSIAEPQVKLLACGDTGRGAMCSVHDIVTMTQHLLLTRKQS